MNAKNRARHAIVSVVIASSIATAVGATGSVRAEGEVPTDPPAAAQPPDDSPPGTDASDSALPGPTSPPPEQSSTTSSAPTTANAPTTTAPAAITPSTTTPPAAIATTTPAPPTTTPPSAIATTTTVAPTNAVANVVAFSAATKPLSLVATPGNANVKLTWLKPSSDGGAAIDYYQVLRGTSAAGPWTVTVTPSLTYTASALTNGTKYYFLVRAHNSAGYGPYSSMVSAVPRTVPSAPLSTGATPYNSAVLVKWQAPSSTGGAPIDVYAVQVSTTGTSGWTNVAFPTDPPGLTVGLLANGTKYYFRVRAHNAAGWGAPSAVVSAVPRTVPSAPVSCSATNGNTLWIAFGWQPPTSNGGAAITSYRIELWKDGSLYSTTTAPASAPHAQAAPVGSTGLYYVRVMAQNAAGVGAPCYTFVYV